ncbi:MAG: radical SAM protein [Deltaproteobacteria bacterium]|nr:MAG: radical SAM protein [Deltaproteobacteria bacterium]
MLPLSGSAPCSAAGAEEAGGHAPGGGKVLPVRTSLPKETISLCPECLRTISAEVFEENGRVMMRKSCTDHGTFTDVIFSDVEMYRRMGEWYFGDGGGFSNPVDGMGKECPDRCGICGVHSTHTSLANIDLTGRCNLSCAVCFADANRNPYEPSFEQVVEMLRRLRAQRPAPAFAVQFTGGEPTLHPQFLEIVAEARKMGFSHIQAATNGIRFADPEFARRARDAGLHYLYLQMDGTTDDVFMKLRGKALLDTKLRVIDSARKAGLRIIFVPTIVKGVNDHQIGDLCRLAFEHLDVLSGISFQPMTFTGRYPDSEREKLRFTLSDLSGEFSRQTGLTHLLEDWFPLNAAVPLVRYAGAVTGNVAVNHACHPHCGLMTLLFVGPNREAVPITRFLDLRGLLGEVERLTGSARKSRVKSLSKMRALQAFYRFFREDRAPEGLTFLRFLKTLDGFAEKKYSWAGKYDGHTYKTFYVLGMHFMDAYNFDLERVSRCGVHYSAPDGKIYPFCTYNSGPVHRHRVENPIASS